MRTTKLKRVFPIVFLAVAALLICWIYRAGLPGQRALEFRVVQNGTVKATAIVGMPDSRPLEECWNSLTDEVVFTAPEGSDPPEKLHLPGEVSMEITWGDRTVDEVVLQSLTLVRFGDGWRLDAGQIQQIQELAEG